MLAYGGAGNVQSQQDTNTQRVLVVDPLDETREVLETVLSRRGVRIASAARREDGIRLAREFHPDVVVLDSELAPALQGQGEACAESVAEASEQSFESTSPANPPALILLGSVRRGACAGGARYVQKPYLYGRLVHTIEELLAERRAA